MMDNRTFIVAELSANHNGSIEIAKKTMDAAKLAGADAVKLQTYTADTITIDSNKDYFQKKMVYGKVILYISFIKRLIHLGSGTENCLIMLIL